MVNRLEFLINVGLDYLTLSRSAGTLSGGENQRIRLAAQIGSSLTGVLYVLDEPSIGLHQKDNQKLINTMKAMRDLGNSLIVVEHDTDTMKAADYLIDVGPLAGINGGKVIATGSVDDLIACKQSITGKYLSGEYKIPVPKQRRGGNGKRIILKGAKLNNLKNINVTFPLGKLICVTGVSGSGKSTLVNETLVANIKKILFNPFELAPKVTDLTGIQDIDNLIVITQEPIGRTPRSNPATYTGLFDDIRTVFANTPEAKARGYDKGRFSFNVESGRCEKCQGDGYIRIEMHFLPDVYVKCDECGGKRYNAETLSILYKNKSIYDVLEMSVDEAYDFFQNIPSIKRKLELMKDVGLGYLKLGEPSVDLSGGEAQRIKLAKFLQRKASDRTIIVLDEPSTGLHQHDIAKLIEVLNRIVDNGATVIIIEHNLDIIKCADYIIDLGPDGGDRGGRIITTGTPEQILKDSDISYTAKFLKPLLKK
ncbi:MAG: excinuclease ABC subunit UvrA [Mycoplasmoidaceae bacterium]|nr:excinuclease ABC subunit UvrA [Mycoplasmoidaceae bacterium]